MGAVGLVLLLIGIFTTGHGGAHEEAHALNEVSSELLADASMQDHAVEGHETDVAAQAEGSEEHAAAEGHHGGFSWINRLWVNLWINNIYFLSH